MPRAPSHLIFTAACDAQNNGPILQMSKSRLPEVKEVIALETGRQDLQPPRVSLCLSSPGCFSSLLSLLLCGVATVAVFRNPVSRHSRLPALLRPALAPVRCSALTGVQAYLGQGSSLPVGAQLFQGHLLKR